MPNNVDLDDASFLYEPTSHLLQRYDRPIFSTANKNVKKFNQFIVVVSIVCDAVVLWQNGWGQIKSFSLKSNTIYDGNFDDEIRSWTPRTEASKLHGHKHRHDFAVLYLGKVQDKHLQLITDRESIELERSSAIAWYLNRSIMYLIIYLYKTLCPINQIFLKEKYLIF